LQFVKDVKGARLNGEVQIEEVIVVFNHKFITCILLVFFKGVLETRFGSLESENRVPTGPYRVPNIFL